MYQLEQIEWSQSWFADTQTRNVPRAFLIGDSISVGYRDEVNRILNGRMLADTYSTSKALDNPFLSEEINHLIGQVSYPYAVFHINNGLHGLHLTTADYKARLRALVLALRQQHPDARFILALSTGIRDDEHPGRFDPRNAQVLERNDAVRALAAELSMELDDLYACAAQDPSYGKGDGFHFTDAGSRALAACVAASLLQ